MSKPLIGVTPLFDRERDSYWMLPGYFLALESVGAVPVMLPLSADEAALSNVIESLDGFLITGGPDAAPAYYGEETKPGCGEICPERDTLEMALLRLLWDADKPVFGICRGLQMMNVQRGGTLFQDLPTEHPFFQFWFPLVVELLCPWTEEPGRLQSMRSLRVRHD